MPASSSSVTASEEPEAGTLTQMTSCKSRQRKNLHVFETLPKCHVCESGRTSTGCLFAACRKITESGRVIFQYDPVIKSSLHRNPLYRNVFNRPMTQDIARLKMAACARILFPLLLAEQSHIRQLGLVRRPRELEFRVACDVCRSTLFSQCWMCQNCGRELCGDCASSLNGPGFVGAACSSYRGVLHSRKDLLPTTRFQDDELETIIQRMNPMMVSPAKPHHPPISVPQPQGGESVTIQHAPTFHQNQITFAEFQQYLAQGIPVVVTNVEMQGKWDPAYFIRTFGHIVVTVEDCETGKTYRSTIQDFFFDFGGARSDGRILKIKDWPTQKLFSAQCPELFQDFQSFVPFGDVTRLDGILNVAAHFPSNGVAPDLGPKLYNATASVQDNQHSGSTKLHMDLTDAVNVMGWAASNPDGKPGTALWHLFSHQHVPTIRQFFRNLGFMGPGCPIHSQLFYMGPGMLDALFVEHGIRPYTVHQHPGDAVFIPAGSPHQVSNVAAGIKSACDFISVETLERTQKLVAEFRTQRLFSSGEDVLNFYTTLFYAFLWLSAELESLPDGGRMEGPADSTGISFPLVDSVALVKVDNHVTVPSSSARSIRRKAKRKAKQAELVFGERPSSSTSGHTFACPFSFCQGEFNRSGLFDHLHSSHSNLITLVKYSEAEMQLRQPKVVRDSDVLPSLQQYLLTRS